GGLTGGAGIYAIGIDGSNLHRVFAVPAVGAFVQVRSLRFSHDGGRVTFAFFVYNEAGASPTDIWVMNADGSSAHAITTDGKSFSPAYEGNGKIVFASTRDGHSEIYAMNADGSSPIRLTNTASS